MKRIDAGTVGITNLEDSCPWSNLPLSALWQDVIQVLAPDSVPRPIQRLALGDYQILQSRKNLIISAPTNSGKSLVGLLPLLDAVRQGKRAVLLEPLRAIAQEKVETLQAFAEALSVALHRPLSVTITTGDYRLEHEAFADSPPSAGELIIATPERLEAIMRDPEHDPWLNSIAAVCVDEAHLITSSSRGPTLEYLLTSLLCLPMPPRLILLSATLGDVTEVQTWLEPCTVIKVDERYPPLKQEVISLEADEDANVAVTQLTRDILADPQNNLLIFVYQTRSAETLAEVLQAELAATLAPHSILAYHSQMPMVRRQAVQTAFLQGAARCLVTTTALGLGVNLPATHAILRDTTFAGSGRLAIADIVQMMGRAGRGGRPGHAMAIVRARDGWHAEELVRALKQPEHTALVSRIAQRPSSWRVESQTTLTQNVATQVAALLARRPENGYTEESLRAFFSRSLGGTALVAQLSGALNWLSDPYRLLAYEDEHATYRLTVLGLNATRAVLPLPLASSMAQLLRDVLAIDPSDQLLRAWQPLDHLIILAILHDRVPRLRRFSKALAEQIDAWMEQHPTEVPLLYREWIAGTEGASRAVEVLGSLGIAPNTLHNADDLARRMAYQAVFHAIILYERSLGKSADALSRQWRIQNLVGVEERWRDDFLWLLSGAGAILELRAFYYHLREQCQADSDRIQRVKRILRQMQRQTFDLQGQLKYCSPLGSVLVSLRRTRRNANGPTIGPQSIAKLERAGVTSLQQLAQLKTDDLVRLGLRRDLAQQVHNYVRQRML